MNLMKWEHRFLELAYNVAKWSKDPSTTVGAVLVDEQNNVRTLGYNGFPRGICDSRKRLSSRELKYGLTVHAEQNVISTCSQLGIQTKNCTLVCTHLPCTACAGSIIQAGIKKVVVQEPNADFLSRWKDSVEVSKEMFAEAGVELVVIDLNKD